MLKWLVLILIVMVLIQYFDPWLRRIKFGRLPGDLTFILFKRVWRLPLTSAFLLSVLLELISKII
jgi:hypothetical protein